MSLWVSENHWMLWLVLAMVLGLSELLFLEFSCLMLAAAALVTAVFSLVVPGLWAQTLVFAGCSFLLFLLLRPELLGRMARSSPETLNNAARLVGQPVTVLEPVDSDHGLVRLDGESWTARTQAPEGMARGESGTVLEIDGATVLVGPSAGPVPP